MHAVVVKVTITPGIMVLDGTPVTGHGRATEPTATTFSRSSRARISGLGVWSAGR
jgi:hypothetical protein